MPPYTVDEARERVKPEQLDAFEKVIAEAEAEGRVVEAVFVANGVPVLYSVEGKD